MCCILCSSSSLFPGPMKPSLTDFGLILPWNPSQEPGQNQKSTPSFHIFIHVHRYSIWRFPGIKVAPVIIHLRMGISMINHPASGRGVAHLLETYPYHRDDQGIPRKGFHPDFSGIDFMGISWKIPTQQQYVGFFIPYIVVYPWRYSHINHPKTKNPYHLSRFSQMFTIYHGKISHHGSWYHDFSQKCLRDVPIYHGL